MAEEDIKRRRRGFVEKSEPSWICPISEETARIGGAAQTAVGGGGALFKCSSPLNRGAIPTERNNNETEQGVADLHPCHGSLAEEGDRGPGDLTSDPFCGNDKPFETLESAEYSRTSKSGDIYKYKVLDRGVEHIKELCGRKGCVYRVIPGGDNMAYIISPCTAGRIQTMVNLYQEIGLPLAFPPTNIGRASPSLALSLSKLSVGILTSYDSFAGARHVHGRGFLHIHGRGITIFKLSKILNIRIEVIAEDIDSLAVLGSRHQQTASGSGIKKGMHWDLYLPLKYPPKVFVLENSIALSGKLKERCTPAEKIEALGSFVWKRAQANDVECFREGHDLEIGVGSADLTGGKECMARGEDDSNGSFSDSGLVAQLVAILRRYKVCVAFSNVKKVALELSSSEIVEFFANEDFDRYYAILSLVSRKFRYLANKISREDLHFLRENNTAGVCRALDLTLRHRFDPVDMRMAGNPGNAAVLRVVTVTPMGIEYDYDVLGETSRLLRNFDHDKFLRFSIRDCNGRRFVNDGHADYDGVYEYFRRAMLDGLAVGPRRYFFLASTASQLKEHHAWFVTPYEQNGVLVGTNYIKSWLGAFKDIKNIGKYAVRIGQALSTTVDSCEVCNFVEIPDMERNGYCFTDGIGLISPSKALQVARALGLSSVPSAFQIRFAGYKGVIAVHPLLESPRTAREWCERNCLQYADRRMYDVAHNDGLHLVLRASMNKFASTHRMLEIVKLSKSTEFYLNRQIITVLEGLGIPGQVFRDLQDRFVLDVLYEITNDLPAFIYKYFHAFPRRVISSDHRMFRKMTAPILTKVFEDLSKKSKIFVPEGRAAMGVSDELGVLEHNEVFLMFPDDGDSYLHAKRVVRYGQYVVPLGKAIIAKNPCIHPGDVRVAVCVDRPELHYMKDVIVFSQKGDRPLFNQCSGSDLDGDVFLLSWRPSLLPQATFKPYNYVTTSALTKETVLQSDMVNFYIRYVKTNKLGMIAHAFAAMADKHSIFSPQALRLAELFNRNIDFIKTGNFATLPEDLIPDEYPDYMEKQPSYVSETIVGQLYRRANAGNVFTTCECRKCTGENLRRLSHWQQKVLMGVPIVVREEFYDRNLDRRGKIDKHAHPAETTSERQKGSGIALFEDYKAEITSLLTRHKVKNEESLLFHKDSVHLHKDLKCIMACYKARLKSADMSEVASMCLGCRENVNSLIWLSDSASQVRCRKSNYNGKGRGNCIFNDNMVLKDRMGERPSKTPPNTGECLVLEVDMKRYLNLIRHLEKERFEVFKEAFNLIYATSKHEFDQVIDILAEANVRMRSHSRIEFARSIFLTSDDLLFRIGLLVVLDCSIVTKVLMLRHEKRETSRRCRPVRIPRRLCLILSGMLDDNEDVGFERAGKLPSVGEVFVPALKNRGTCSVDYYMDVVRDFLINILLSNESLCYCAERMAARSSPSIAPEESRLQYELVFVPGRFYAARLDAALVYDKMSIRELQALMDRNDPRITTWFVGGHRCLDGDLRRDAFTEMKNMAAEPSCSIFSFVFKGTRYELEYVNSVLVRVVADRKHVGKAYIVNSCEMGASENTEKKNDLMIDMMRYEVLYTSEYSVLAEDEMFILGDNMFQLKEGGCHVCVSLSGCSSFRLEVLTNFKNGGSFCISHRITYTGTSPYLAAGSPTLRCYAARSWPSDYPNFGRIFSKLWRTYVDVLCKG